MFNQWWANTVQVGASALPMRPDEGSGNATGGQFFRGFGDRAGNGAGAALSGDADLVSQSFATLGLRGAYQFVVGQGGLATFSGGIGWRRGFGEAPTAQPGFNGGSPFDIAATPAAANSPLLEAGVDLDQAEGFVLQLNHAGEAVAGGPPHALRAG